jgi:hypothetical protein
MPRTRVAGRGRAAPPRSHRPAEPGGRVAAAAARAHLRQQNVLLLRLAAADVQPLERGERRQQRQRGDRAGLARQRARVVDEGQTGAAVVSHDPVVGSQRRRDPVAGQVGLLRQEAVLLQAEQVEALLVAEFQVVAD